MKILFDHQVFSFQRYGGISRYFCELMDQFTDISDLRFSLGIRYSSNENLVSRKNLYNNWSNQSKFLCNSKVFPYIQKKYNVDLLNLIQINNIESIRMLKKSNYDLFHPTYYNPYFLKYIEKRPYVLTVYDMIHELYPESFSKKDPVSLWKKKLIQNATSIISISESTKKDIIDLYGTDDSKIRVVYLGNPLENITKLQEKDSFSVEKEFSFEYLLFVGKRSGCKNFQFFIKCIAEYLIMAQKHVVCAGGGFFTPDEISLFKKLDIINKIHYVDINDSNICKLYLNARAFIFPSLYEGFGLPVLEAFSCGCPVILSSSSSLPEVGGDAACYINPESSESIMQGVKCVCSDENYRSDLIDKGFKQLKIFSWRKTSIETKKVYEDTLK